MAETCCVTGWQGRVAATQAPAMQRDPAVRAAPGHPRPTLQLHAPANRTPRPDLDPPRGQ